MQLLSGNQTGSITASVSDFNEWSDWNGKPASEVLEAFEEAIRHVQTVGLSFGGVCFFETGVTPDPSTTDETFSSTFTEQ
jgi:hypothetical protein